MCGAFLEQFRCYKMAEKEETLPLREAALYLKLENITLNTYQSRFTSTRMTRIYSNTRS